MDGLEDLKGVVVIVATNRPDIVDDRNGTKSVSSSVLEKRIFQIIVSILLVELPFLNSA
jgi:SpoVK/Ycf46/Vps4 family AAA+-type ATPase